MHRYWVSIEITVLFANALVIIAKLEKGPRKDVDVTRDR